MDSNKYFLWTRLIPGNLIIFIATLGGASRLSKFPGTIGSLLGFFLYFTLYYLDYFYYTICCLIIYYLSIGICSCAERILNEKDSSYIILDEFIAVPIIFWGLNEGNSLIGYDINLTIYIIGFLVFRLIDIFKPFGIKKLENIKGGLGCVIDDFFAAIISCFILYLFLYLCF